MTVVFVPGDSGARSVGADAVANALVAKAAERGLDVTVIRNGSRGMLWLEPLVEVVTEAGRVGYGGVAAAEIDELLAAGMLVGAASPNCIGIVDELDWLTKQERFTFARVGVTDPLSLADYEAHGGLVGLRRAIELTPTEVVAAVLESGLRGRGGAGFPAGIKWRTVLETESPTKFVVINADEGDSGTYADRMLLEGDPFLLIEGCVIAGLSVRAEFGFVYIRSEYPDAIATFNRALDVARAAGWLGADILGSGRAFDLEVRVGAGAYICGEETSLLESIEGRRPVVRSKPPLPAIEGLFRQPTLVNNVLTVAAVPFVLANGAAAYQELGMGRSRGTQVFQLAGNVARPGIVELAFGVSVDELVNTFGGGTRTGRPVHAVQVGGPLGAYLPVEQLSLPMDYEALLAAGAMLGHGGIVVFDDGADMWAQARFAMSFCAAESCGKCTPCRIGAVRGVEVIDRISQGTDVAANLVLLEDLCELMTDGSLCALGGLTPLPVRSVLRHFSSAVPASPTPVGPSGGSR